jgi:hypothetical protein
MVTEAGESGEDARAGGGDDALETGGTGTVSWGLAGSESFFITFLLLSELSREWQPFI